MGSVPLVLITSSFRAKILQNVTKANLQKIKFSHFLRILEAPAIVKKECTILVILDRIPWDEAWTIKKLSMFLQTLYFCNRMVFIWFSRTLSLKYKKSTTLGCRDLRIRKSAELVQQELSFFSYKQKAENR